MILARFVDEIPHLKLPDLNRIGALVMPFVHERLQADRPVRFGVFPHEWVDPPKRLGNVRARRGRGANLSVANRSREVSPFPRS